MSEHAPEPIEVDAVFTDHGHLELTGDSVTKVARQLGHAPKAGEAVRLSVIRGPQQRSERSPGEQGALANVAHLEHAVDIPRLRREMSHESEWVR